MAARYAIGIDFGTESGRALLVDVATGRELAIIGLPVPERRDHRVPAGPRRRRPARTGLGAPGPDGLRADAAARGPGRPRGHGRRPGGRDRDRDRFHRLHDAADDRRRHAARAPSPSCAATPTPGSSSGSTTPRSPRRTGSTRSRASCGEAWLPRYGGKISSEWFFSKSLQILDEAPDIYRAADRLIEAADWVVWQLTGVETRNSCTAGYKAIWSKADGFPGDGLLRGARAAASRGVVDDKMSRTILPIGDRAGSLTAEAAAWTGLRAGTAVAVANVDAHASVPASTVTGPGRMVAVMGTSTCHLVLGDRPAVVEGMCGVVEDGILPGLFGFEAGQSGGRRHLRVVRGQRRPGLVRARRRGRGHRRPRPPRAGGREARARRERVARPRLVERQPLDPGRRRTCPGCWSARRWRPAPRTSTAR